MNQPALAFRTAPAACAALLLAGGAALLLCTPAAADTLRRGAVAEPNSLDPQVVSGASSTIMRDLFTGLTSYDSAGRLIPGAAESWEISEDGLTYRFRLREKLKWSDGTPVAAKDFVYTLRRLLTPGNRTRFGSFFYSIRNARRIMAGELDPAELGVRAEGERTFVIELQRPDATLLEKLSNYAAAALPQAVIEEHGRRWSRPGRLVTTGPYRLAEWVPQSHLTLEKNPHFYAADAIEFETVQYFPTSNAETAMRRFLAGDLEFLLTFPADRMEWIEENLPGQLKIWPALGISYITFNNRKPPFDDVRVRRALTISVNRERIAERIMVVGVPPAYTMTPYVVSDYDNPVPDYAHRPMPERLAEARSLLEAAGYGPNRPLTFELRYEPPEENRRLAIALQAIWREIGVNTELLFTDFGTLYRSVGTGDYTAARFTWFSPTDSPETFLFILESGATTNYSGYSNPDYDRLIALAEAQLDPDARLAAYREAEAMALADFPVMPLYFMVHRNLVAPDIRGYTPNSRGMTATRFLYRAK